MIRTDQRWSGLWGCGKPLVFQGLGTSPSDPQAAFHPRILLRNQKNKLGQLAQSSVLAGIAGLNNLEVVALATIAENADAPDSFVPAYTIRRDMESQGYTKVAVTLSAATLLKKNMLETRQEQDFHGNTAVEYAMTNAGMEWLIQNQSRLVLRHETKEPTPEDPSTDNDIPF